MLSTTRALFTVRSMTGHDTKTTVITTAHWALGRGLLGGEVALVVGPDASDRGHEHRDEACDERGKPRTASELQESR